MASMCNHCFFVENVAKLKLSGSGRVWRASVYKRGAYVFCALTSSQFFGLLVAWNRRFHDFRTVPLSRISQVYLVQIDPSGSKKILCHSLLLAGPS
jgi:hypothetical protein